MRARYSEELILSSLLFVMCHRLTSQKHYHTHVVPALRKRFVHIINLSPKMSFTRLSDSPFCHAPIRHPGPFFYGRRKRESSSLFRIKIKIMRNVEAAVLSCRGEEEKRGKHPGFNDGRWLSQPLGAGGGDPSYGSTFFGTICLLSESSRRWT